MHSFVISKYTLIEAYKRRFILFYGLILLLCIGLAGYAGNLSLTSKQATLSAFYCFSVRISAVVMLAIYIILNESKALDSDHAFAALGLPISRATFLFNKFLAYSVIVFAMTVTAALPLLITNISLATVSAWVFSFYCELLLIILLTLMLIVLFTQPLTSILLVGIFYLFSRSSAEFLRHSNNIIAAPASIGDQVVAWLVKIAAFLVPRLEQFAVAGWILHDTTENIQWANIVTQTLVYGALLYVITLSRLQQRTF